MEKQPIDAEQQDWLTANINAFSAHSSALVLTEATGNTLYSPASAYLALAVLYECADGENKEEILALLQNSSPGEQAEMSAALLGNMNFNNSKGQLSTSNALFASEGISVPADLANLLSEYYGVQLYANADLSDSTEVDLWINEHTNGHIAGLDVQPSEGVSVIILNSVFFQNSWLSPFSKGLTAPDTFYLGNGSEVTCDFMQRTLSGNVAYTQTDAYTSTYLGFENGFTMHFILPHEGITPTQLLAETDLFSTALDYTVENPAAVRGEGEILFRTPKLDFSDTIGLVDVLQAMGMTAAFHPIGASQFRLTAESGIPLFVSDVRQQSLFQMDEKGAKAVSVTIIEMNETTGIPPEPEDPLYLEFILDRPFLFAIETQEGYLLFTGIVNDPTLFKAE